MTLCDTHLHLFAPEWAGPVETRLATAGQNNIELLLQPGVRSSGWDEMLALARKYPQVYAAPGLHPMCAEEWDEALAERLRTLCGSPEVLAIGEIGLDALLQVDMARQEKAFHGQLEIAGQVDLPVLIHCRKKTTEVLAALERSQVRGIWHGFSGSLETARRIIDLGFSLGIGPVLLRDNARKLPEVVKKVPAESLVLETDAPDMAGGPEVLGEVARKIAELRGWTFAETARITTANARRILDL